MKRKLITTPRFQRDGRRLLRRQPRLEAPLRRVLAALAENAFAPHLRTHKLKGGLSNLWACSVAYDCRLVFSIRSDSAGEVIELLSVGTHDDVY
jgi:addiction module RelE/StbE family toxin